MTPAIALALTDRLSAIDLRVLRVQEIVEELGQENSTTHHDLVVCRRLLAGIIDRLVVRSAGWSSETLAGLSAEGATPAHQSEDEFLGQVTPENTHPDLDANPPVGREQW